MPVYEYYCEKCDSLFEQYRELKERATCACPKCGKAARKMFRPVGIVFKGSGFHVNDYPSTGTGERAEEKAKSEAEPAAVGGEANPPIRASQMDSRKGSRTES